MITQQGGGGIDAADAWKLEIHENHVGMVFGEELACSLATVGFGDDFEIVLKLQRGDEATADDEVIIDQKQGDG
jgi:hypothetical protein